MKVMAIQPCDTHRMHIQHYLLIAQLADLGTGPGVTGIGEKYLPWGRHRPDTIPVFPSPSLLRGSAYPLPPLQPGPFVPLSLLEELSSHPDKNLPCFRALRVLCFESPICHPWGQTCCLPWPRLPDAPWPLPSPSGLFLCHYSDLHILWVLLVLLVNLEMSCLQPLTALMSPWLQPLPLVQRQGIWMLHPEDLGLGMPNKYLLPPFPVVVASRWDTTQFCLEGKVKTVRWDAATVNQLLWPRKRAWHSVQECAAKTQAPKRSTNFWKLLGRNKNMTLHLWEAYSSSWCISRKKEWSLQGISSEQGTGKASVWGQGRSWSLTRKRDSLEVCERYR